MNDTVTNVIDARLQDALSQYFSGVAFKQTVGDCAILSGVRKQNGAPVDIYTPSFEMSRDDKTIEAIAKQFDAFNKLSSNRLQSPERLLKTRNFKKNPVLAVLLCLSKVFDDTFDTHGIDVKIRIFGEILEGLAVLHSAGIVHGNVCPDAVRREEPQGRCGSVTTRFAEIEKLRSQHSLPPINLAISSTTPSHGLSTMSMPPG